MYKNLLKNITKFNTDLRRYHKYGLNSTWKIIPSFIWVVLLSPFNSQDLSSNSPYYLPYNSCDVSSENLVLDQLIIPKLIFFFILITYLVYILFIL